MQGAETTQLANFIQMHHSHMLAKNILKPEKFRGSTVCV